jgi:hypothetical protein
MRGAEAVTPVPERIRVGDLAVRVYDRGPEPASHKDRSLFGPWRRYVAELSEDAGASETGSTPWQAIYRLVAMRRPDLMERWPAKGPDER